jgi:uncharacterized membrane-anchored protein
LAGILKAATRSTCQQEKFTMLDTSKLINNSLLLLAGILAFVTSTNDLILLSRSPVYA